LEKIDRIGWTIIKDKNFLFSAAWRISVLGAESLLLITMELYFRPRGDENLPFCAAQKSKFLSPTHVDQYSLWSANPANAALVIEEFAFSRNAMIPPVQIGIGTTLHEKSIFPATGRCQHHKDGRERGCPRESRSGDRGYLSPSEKNGV
jgi:hypothetical protein